MAGTATISSQESPASSRTSIATPPVMPVRVSSAIYTCFYGLLQPLGDGSRSRLSRGIVVENKRECVLTS